MRLELVQQHPYRELIKLSGPLILSMSGLMLMQFIDALMLSWYSPKALAAVGAAGIAQYGFMCVFLGCAGYAYTIVAHYMGAGNEAGTGKAVWQSVHLSTISGIIVAAGAFGARPFFDLVGHDPEVRRMEVTFFAICCIGGVLPLWANALSTFFTGRGATRTVMIVQIIGLVINGVLDYLLIFGKFGLPRLGVAGAAIATTAAQGCVALMFAAMFMGKRAHRRCCGAFAGWKPDRALMMRLLRFGLPSGFRMAVEVLSWTLFVFFVGRIGPDELASSTIAWRLNGFAFFPVIGLAQAAGIIVGTAQGRGLPAVSVDITGKAMVISEVWMLLWVALFLLIPAPLYALFAAFDPNQAAGFGRIAAMGAVLLRFVAAYCLLDACNIVFVTALQSAGDTRWTFCMTLLLYGLFAGALTVADVLKWGLYPEWIIATVFVMGLALVWVYRFYKGKWKGIRVVEEEIGGE